MIASHGGRAKSRAARSAVHRSARKARRLLNSSGRYAILPACLAGRNSALSSIRQSVSVENAQLSVNSSPVPPPGFRYLRILLVPLPGKILQRVQGRELVHSGVHTLQVRSAMSSFKSLWETYLLEFLECVSRRMGVQIRADLVAIQGNFPQACRDKLREINAEVQPKTPKNAYPGFLKHTQAGG